jgi:PAS domain S-box-containing protein
VDRLPHLPQSGTELEEFFDLSIDLLCIVGFDGYFKRVNASLERTLGYPKAELFSRSVFDITHPDDVQPSREALAQLGEGHDVVGFESRVVCADGSVRWLEWNTRTMPERGVVYGVARDTTERRRAEAELRGAQRMLEASRDELRVLAEEQAALRRVATLVARETPPDAVFAAVGREVGEVLGVDATHLGRYDSDGTVVSVAQWGSYAGVEIGARFPLEGDSVSARVLRTGRPARMDSYEDAPGVIAATIRQIGIRFSIGVPISVEGRPWGVMIATSKGPNPFPAETESRLQDFTELVATAIANTEARSQVDRLAEEQAGLRRVATLVARGVPPAEVFEAVAREAGQLLGVDAMHMGRYDASAAISVAGWSRAGDHLPVGTRVELDGTNVASLVLRSGRPARIDGYSAASGATAERLRHGSGVYSSVAVPIVVDDRLWGLMIASSKQYQPLAADTESRLLGFTELVATAISNTEVRTELAASRARLVAAADEERRRVVRDLHDGAQQRLVHTVVMLKLAEVELQDQEGRASELVKEALAHAQSATAEVRELAHGILPSVLTHGGLPAATHALASRMTVPVEIDVSAPRLPEQIEATAYFVMAEALTNVAKHARAQHATVTGRVDNGALRIEVRDDGEGGARTEGGGLIGLRDRVATLDGTLTVDSPPGGGTVVTATIPPPARR